MIEEAPGPVAEPWKEPEEAPEIVESGIEIPPVAPIPDTRQSASPPPVQGAIDGQDDADRSLLLEDQMALARQTTGRDWTRGERRRYLREVAAE